MRFTQWFNFKKPEPFDTVNINDLNDSFDLIDEKLKETVDDNKSLSQQFKNLIINAGNSNAEVAASRGNFDYLPKRLDNFDSSLEQKTSELKDSILYVDNKLGSMGNIKIFKGSCLYSELPSTANLDEYWYVSDKDTNYCWNGSKWVDIGNNLNIGKNAINEENINYKSVTNEKITFVEGYQQLLDKTLIELNKYYNHGAIDTVNSENACIYPPIKIKKGVKYYTKNIYCYFSTLKYDDGELIALSENSREYDISFTPIKDGLLYPCINKIHYNEKRDFYICNTENFPTSYVFGDYDVKINRLKDNSISFNSLEKSKEVIQYINGNVATPGKFYSHGAIGQGSAANVCIIPPIRIIKGRKYYYKDLYAYFTTIKYDDGTMVALTEKTTPYMSGEFIAEDNGYVYVTINTTRTNVLNKTASLSNSSNGLNGSIFGYIGVEIDDLLLPQKNKKIEYNVITVMKDGTGDFTKVTDAINSIKDSSFYNRYNVYVYSGIYDLVTEFGGDEWINSISHSNGEMQGLLLPNYVNLFGFGSVEITCIVEDEKATEDFARCVSTINVNQSNKLYGITFKAKNTRYVIHDENGNSYANIEREIDSCRFIQLGNKQGLWSANKAMGGGTGSGGRYKIKNCYFESPFIPFSYHNNGNQKSNIMEIDGCIFVSENNPYGYDIGFGYYKNNTDKFYITVKNCASKRGVKKYQETSSVTSDDVFEITEINNVIR